MSAVSLAQVHCFIACHDSISLSHLEYTQDLLAPFHPDQYVWKSVERGLSLLKQDNHLSSGRSDCL